ncbi:MAG: AAA family ATPase, partial [Sphaerochaeta associata]|uniref:ATP-binding protein n=1 Tax=Sphaerochaeta associata TaxID=1129264 RepID=UPI002B20B11C
MSQYIPRVIDTLLEEYLETFGAVYIRGPKWCGKTTTAEQKAKSIVRFQDPKTGESNRMMAEIDPSLLLKGDNPRLLDEWQVVPKIWDAVRLQVDDLKVEGLFILTGSTVPVDDDQRHSGTGRISRLTMRPMSLMESGESNGKVSLSSLFLGKAIEPGMLSSLAIPQLAYVMVRGGWPASIGKSERAAGLIAQEYLVSLAESDVSRTTKTQKNPERVRALLRSYARNVSTLATNKNILRNILENDMSFSESLFYEYLNALQRLYVIEDVSAWNPSIRSKTAIRSRPKREFVDPSLAVAAIGLSSAL